MKILLSCVDYIISVCDQGNIRGFQLVFIFRSKSFWDCLLPYNICVCFLCYNWFLSFPQLFVPVDVPSVFKSFCSSLWIVMVSHSLSSSIFIKSIHSLSYHLFFWWIFLLQISFSAVTVTAFSMFIRFRSVFFSLTSGNSLVCVFRIFVLFRFHLTKWSSIVSVTFSHSSPDMIDEI